MAHLANAGSLIRGLDMQVGEQPRKVGSASVRGAESMHRPAPGLHVVSRYERNMDGAKSETLFLICGHDMEHLMVRYGARSECT